MTTNRIGMDIRNRYAAPANALATCALLALLSLVSSACNVLDPDVEAAVARDSTVTELTGEQLYIEHCAGCHGLDGKPTDTLTVISLVDWPGTFEKFDSTLTSGPGAMPDYPQLDNEERNKIFEHIKQF